ncbi:hypothetical protein P7C71_g3271, partial [Lecanoromycetidae sp. Uapishka_2]
MEDAREKAEAYLLESDVPRPSVVVVFDFVEQETREEYRNIDVHFEVVRRDPGMQGAVKVYEKGVVWPRDKAETELNTKEIVFSLEEIFGTVEVIDRALRIPEDSSQIRDSTLREMLEDLPSGLLQCLKEKVKNDEGTTLPISSITKVVARKLRVQRGNDAFMNIQAGKTTRPEGYIPEAQQERVYKRRED